jgi:hypothetical protein
MSLNRIVALLTPLVFAPLAGVISTWAAENLPGVNVPPNAVEEIFIAGALIALAPAAQWLHGWQKWEAREQETLLAAATGFAVGETVPAATEEAAVVVEADVELDDFEDLDDLDDFDEFEDISVEEDEPVLAGS